MNYSEEEKEAIKYLDMMENKINFDLLGYVYGNEAIDTLLNLIQKQEKIIDKMAEQFYNLYKNIEVVRDSFDMPFGKFLKSKEELIEYFKKVVDKDVKN